MASTKSATKSYKQAERRRVYNLRVLRAMKKAIKQVRQYIAHKDAKQATAILTQVYKAIDKAAKRGVIKKNNASRKKSRIMAGLAKLVATEKK